MGLAPNEEVIVEFPSEFSIEAVKRAAYEYMGKIDVCFFNRA